MKPFTVGQLVHFHEAFIPDHPQAPKAAIIAYVVDEDMVNLTVFDYNGNGRGVSRVGVRHEGEVAPSEAHCEAIPEPVAVAPTATLAVPAAVA